jgi:hypothetical protein
MSASPLGFWDFGFINGSFADAIEMEQGWASASFVREYSTVEIEHQELTESSQRNIGGAESAPVNLRFANSDWPRGEKLALGAASNRWNQ